MIELQVDSDLQEVELKDPSYVKLEPVNPEAVVEIQYKGFFWSEATASIPFVRKGADIVKSISVKSDIPTLVRIYEDE